MTRGEHVRWCKQRALEYVDLGQVQMAVSSMVSDMSKHPDTQAAIHSQLRAGMVSQAGGAEDVRRWIEGFGG